MSSEALSQHQRAMRAAEQRLSKPGPPAAPASPASPGTPAPAGPTGPTPATAVQAAVSALAQRSSGHVAVAVLDTATGHSAYAGDAHRFVTASVAKVDILATLLLQAQRAGRPPNAQEREWARTMIRISDNDAASALWRSVGGAGAVAEANEEFGLTETVPGPGGHWGLTQTTAADQLRLLRAVFGEDSPLDDASRGYAQELMGSVAAGQDWGVSAAAGAERDFALKNGWLPRSATGLWVINSVGRVRAGGDGYLVAVLSDDQRDRTTGITLVEQVAVAAVRALSER